MSWSLNIGTIAGTAVRVHITFLLFLGWIFFASYVAEGPEDAVASLLFMLLLFACVLAHEFGHIFTARAFGIATPDVTLLPIGGVARLERIPEEPREEFLIAIAGPLVTRICTPSSCAMTFASEVFPTPGGPYSATCSSGSLRPFAASMRIRRFALTFS